MKLGKAIRETIRVEVEKAKLSTEARNDLPASAFVFPETRRYPIHDISHARNALARSAGKPEEGKVRAAVERKYPELKKAEPEPVAVDVSVPLWKDDSKQIVYGVALTPGLTDSQGDEIDADEIEKAAHRFLVKYRKHDVQHAEVATDAAGNPLAETVESFIAPSDMVIAGEQVLKGSWVLATHVSDPGTWERVRKGEITGFSIGGSGERFELPAG